MAGQTTFTVIIKCRTCDARIRAPNNDETFRVLTNKRNPLSTEPETVRRRQRARSLRAKNQSKVK